MTGDRELVRIHIETLFTLAAAGKMVRVNEPAGAVAPRFFLVEPNREASGGSNVDVLRPHFAAWVDDVALCQPFVALVTEGHVVSVCCSVRTASAAHEAGVETHPDFRGRGYAAQVVSAWAREVRSHGRVPLYSTSCQNTASQAVARKLRLVRYGTDLHIT